MSRTNEKMNIVLPHLVEGNVTTTSKLKNSDSYKGANLFDNMKEYAWVEGVEGDGIDEKITFTTTQELKLNAVKVWNGYQRSPSHFYANSKLKSASFSNTEVSEELSLDNSDKPQLISFYYQFEGSEFSLTVKEAYTGNSYENLALSELTFYQNSYPIKIKTPAKKKP